MKLGSSLYGLLAVLQVTAGQYLELDAIQFPDGACEPILFRRTQIHKDIQNLEPRTHIERQLQPIEDTAIFNTLLRIFGVTKEDIWARLRSECSLILPTTSDGKFLQNFPVQMPFLGTKELVSPLPVPPPLKVTPLLISGPSDNRIDLVFFGDGYTKAEESKFLRDAKRLAIDISTNQTFSTVKPLLNIWAAFTPSNDSGIGTDLQRLDTAFGLYRVGTELRAIYCGKKPVARSACASLGTGCDYPILLANSEYYGGLGGEFSISTASILNGALVLRHELGHSIINVGEEYDGGFAYFGPNSSPHPLGKGIKWAPWLSKPLESTNETTRVERAVSPLQAYPWTLLNTSDSYVAPFNSSGSYSSHLVRFSLSGLPNVTDLIIRLDDQDIGWTPRQGVGMDRWHYDILRNQALAPGGHTLSFHLGSTATVAKAQLCSLEIIEYGSDGEFNRTIGNIGAYPTFSMWNGTTYRPTNEGCLMRQVILPHFCKPCIEGLWLQLLKRVDLIDKVDIIWDKYEENVFVKLATLKLGQFRGKLPQHESLSIRWMRNGESLHNLDNQTQFILPSSDALGNWRVDVTFHTDEVKMDPKGYLQSSKLFSI